MNEDLAEIIQSRRCETKCELKNRRDVINKTLIRAIKRFFANSFRSMFPPKRFRIKSKRLWNLKQTLAQFTKIYSWNLKHSELYLLFGYLLEAKNFSLTTKKKSIDEVIEARQFTSEFIKWCMSYSHAHFETVSSHRLFKELYLLFKDNGLETFLTSHEERSQNSEEYKAAILELELRIIQN